MYGTFAFFSPLTPKVQLGHIDVTYGAYSTPDPVQNPNPALPILGVAIPVFPSTPVGQSVIVPITLINNSMYPMTMVFPAVTFNDPGYSIVENDTSHPDGCSNKYLLGEQSTLPVNAPLTYYCTAYIQFSPVGADQQSFKNPTPAVNATLIAAGTLNAAPYENILMTSHTQVYGIVNGTRGATLLPTGASFTQYNPNPYVYTFANVSGVTSAAYGEEDFVLTSNYSDGVTISNAVLTEFNSGSGDFAITNDTCSGHTLQSTPATCIVHVQFQPNGQSPLTGPYFATLQVSGQALVNGQAPTGGTNTLLASAAMTGTASLVLTMLATMDSVVTDGGGTYTNTYTSSTYADVIDNCTDYTLDNETDCATQDATIVITNNSNYPVANFKLSETSVNNSIYLVHFAGGSCVGVTTLAGNGTCSVSYPPGQGPMGTNVTIDWAQTLSASGTTTGGTVDASIAIGFENAYFVSVGACEPFDEGCLEGQTVFSPVNASGASQTIPAGNPVQFTFNLAPPPGGNYAGTVSFLATGLPPGASVSFTPQSVATNGGAQTVTMTIQTVANKGEIRRSKSGIEMASLLLCFALPLAAIGRSRKMRRTLQRNLLLVAVVGLAAIAGMVGCNTGANGSSGALAASGPQTYQITVTATMGKAQVTTKVSLTLE